MQAETAVMTVIDLQEASEEGVQRAQERIQANRGDVQLLNFYDCADNRRSLHGLLQDVERGWLVAAVRPAEGDNLSWWAWLRSEAGKWLTLWRLARHAVSKSC